MKKITITLDETTRAWAMDYAAQHNQSVSGLVSQLLHDKMRDSREYASAMRRFWAIGPNNLSDGKAYPQRDEIRERKTVR